MRLSLHKLKIFKKRTGQTLVMFALFIVVLILFIGLGIDIGFLYVTRANLSKSVDSACLVGVRNLSLGDNLAGSMARAAFRANYGLPGRDTGTVTPNVSISTDANNNRLVDISVTVTTRTYFIRILPTWRTFKVSSNAQGTRAKVVMTLVLDRSGSMNNEDSSGRSGADSLPPAVITFINFFDDNIDRVAMASFASHATLDVSMRRPFKTAIRNAVNALDFDGGTFGQGGLTNALVQNNTVTGLPGENIAKVAVFFTDGKANIVQDRLNCPPSSLINFGGYDSGNTVGFFNPSNGRWWPNSQNSSCTTSGGSPPCCSGVNRFQSNEDNSLKTFIRPNVTNEAEFRASQVAEAMRAQGMIVYSIGLGNAINRDFLRQIANDPESSTFNPNQPIGQAVFAPTADQLSDVFAKIAGQILLRLTK